MSAGKGKDVRALVRKLKKRDWKVTTTGSGHYRAEPPGGGEPVIFAKTPSDSHSIRNTIGQLRRHGLPRDAA